MPIRFEHSDDTVPNTARPASARPLHPIQVADPAAAGRMPEPQAMALPEVTEGNLDSDWALWEDSVAFQDSQMSSAFDRLESVRDRGARAAAEPDPFAAVRRRGA